MRSWNEDQRRDCTFKSPDGPRVHTEKMKEGVGGKADACFQFSSFALAARRLDIDTGLKQRR